MTPQRVPGLRDVIDLATARTGSPCALLASGRVCCSGGNHEGQLGTGSTELFIPRPAAVRGLPPVVGLSGPHAHYCAWTEEGRVYCWGYNNDGQLGDGSWNTRRRPVAVIFPGG